MVKQQNKQSLNCFGQSNLATVKGANLFITLFLYKLKFMINYITLIIFCVIISYNKTDYASLALFV